MKTMKKVNLSPPGWSGSLSSFPGPFPLCHHWAFPTQVCFGETFTLSSCQLEPSYRYSSARVCSPDVCLPWYGALPEKGFQWGTLLFANTFSWCYSYFDYTTHPLSLELWLCWDQSSEMEFLWGPQLIDPRLGLSKWCQWDCVGSLRNVHSIGMLRN